MTVRIVRGAALEELRRLEDGSIDLVLTSPPYNIGKAYERRRPLEEWLAWQAEIIAEAARVTAIGGSVCWQVGNYVADGEIVPLDCVLYPHFKAAGLSLRNRIAWTFGHGLHCARRLSHRYEVVLWFTRGDEYFFDLDAVRVPQLYPAKRHYKGPNKGQLSGNPLGKNPGDVWEIPNVKANHPEKLAHPCQFPEELAARLVNALSPRGGTVLDPFSGSGTVGAICAPLGREAILIELSGDYAAIAAGRIAGSAPLLNTVTLT